MSGLPQLDYSWYPEQVFWCSGVLLYIFLLLRFYYMPRMSVLFSERLDRISTFEDKIDEAEKKLATLQKDFDDAINKAHAKHSAEVENARSQTATAYRDYYHSSLSQFRELMHTREDEINDKYQDSGTNQNIMYTLDIYVQSIYDRLDEKKS